MSQCVCSTFALCRFLVTFLSLAKCWFLTRGPKILYHTNSSWNGMKCNGLMTQRTLVVGRYRNMLTSNWSNHMILESVSKLLVLNKVCILKWTISHGQRQCYGIKYYGQFWPKNYFSFFFQKIWNFGLLCCIYM